MIKEIKINTIDELFEQLNKLPNHFIYRGHASAEWLLESSLERVIGRSWSNDSAKNFEDYSLLQFKPKFHLYDHENIEPKSKLAWLSIMQHYGVPTRLLDFTESPYIALYFALETYNPQFQTDLAIFAFDYRAIMKNSIEHIKSKNKKFNEDYSSVYENQDLIFDSVIDKFGYDIVWIAEPQQLNTRLDRQAGSFLFSGNRGLKIQIVLDSELYENVQMYKFCIPSELYVHIYVLLQKMNITSKILYGDLDGLACAIKMHMVARSV